MYVWPLIVRTGRPAMGPKGTETAVEPKVDVCPLITMMPPVAGILIVVPEMV